MVLIRLGVGAPKDLVISRAVGVVQALPDTDTTRADM